MKQKSYKNNRYYKNNPKYFLELRKLYTKHRRQCTSMILAKGKKADKNRKQKLKYLYDWMMEMTEKFFVEVPPRLIEICKWIVEDMIDYPICPVSKKKIRKYQSDGSYANHFSRKESAADPNTKKKREKTCLRNFKAKNVFASEYGKAKIKQSCLDHFGVEFSGAAIQKIENTKKSNLAKYGFENVNQVPEIKQRGVRTGMTRHGQIFNYAQYKYDDQKFDSSWELQLYIYLKDNEIDFQYHNSNICFEYVGEDNKKHLYYPDFVIENQIYEIKGDQFFDENGNPFDVQRKISWKAKYDCMIKNGVKILRKNDLLKVFEYIDSRYGKNYCKQFKTASNKISSPSKES